MTTDPDWPHRLRRAIEKLDATGSAPQWLRDAVRESLAVAPALAPRDDGEQRSADFFYPH